MSALVILICLWGVIALALIVLVIYRGVIGRNEETELMVDQAEHNFAEEQRGISSRIEQLSTPIRFLSIAAGALLLIIVAFWIYQGLQNS